MPTVDPRGVFGFCGILALLEGGIFILSTKIGLSSIVILIFNCHLKVNTLISFHWNLPLLEGIFEKWGEGGRVRAYQEGIVNRPYPPKERFLKTLSEGSHWFECSLLPYVIFCFFGFPLGTRLTYCVVGGGCGVFSQAEEKYLKRGSNSSGPKLCHEVFWE